MMRRADADMPIPLTVREISSCARCHWQFVTWLEAALAGHGDDFDWHLDPLADRIGQLATQWQKTVISQFVADTSWTVVNAGDVPAGALSDYDPGTVVCDVPLSSKYGFSGTVSCVIITTDGVEVRLPKYGSHAHPETMVKLGCLAQLVREAIGDDTPLRCSVAFSSGTVTTYDTDRTIDTAAQVFRQLTHLIDERRARRAPACWFDITHVCGHCYFCRQAIADTHDVMAVAGVGNSTRTTLRTMNINTVGDLATMDPTILPEQIDLELIAQAQAQHRQEHLRQQRHEPDYVYAELLPHVRGLSRQEGGPGLEIPQPGDVYVDFEIDNLRTDQGDDRFGLAYLTGLAGYGIAQWREFADAPRATVDEPAGTLTTNQPGHGGTWTTGPRLQPQPVWQASSVFTVKHPGDFARLLAMDYVPLWAHTYDDEKLMFATLMRFLIDRRRTYPTMRVFHYSHHEPVMLRRLANRHGIYRAELDAMLRDGHMFHDLFSSVTHTVRTGQGGYSLKDMEPLYCGGIERDRDLAAGDDSIVAYNRLIAARERLASGDNSAATTVAEQANLIAAYNEYDCCSMVLLQQWLINFIDYEVHRIAQ